MRHSNTQFFRQSILACAVVTLLSPISFAQEEKVNANETIEELENFSQETSAIDLSKVVVTAGGFSQEIKSAPASISVVSKAELDNAPFRDVTDALKDVPGVVITGGGASQDISIRGMSSGYTLMMVDGKRQSSRATRPNSDGAGIEQGWIPPLAAIDRIEVVRGPMSSRYGSDAMGGVINIITKKVADKWGGNVRTDYTVQHDSDEGNGSNTEFYLNGPLIKETLGLQVYGKYSHRKEDKILDGVPGRRIENIGGKLTFVPVNGQTFELEGGMSSQKRIYTPNKSIADSYYDKKEKKTVKNVKEIDKYKRDNISLRHLGEFDNGIKSDIIFSHEKNNNTSRKMIIKNTEVSGNVIIPIETHTITVGAQYREEKLSDQGNQLKNGVTDLSRWNYAFFIEDEWWLLDNFAITAGLRYDYDEKYGSNFTPRIYAVWNIDDAWTVKGGVSTGYTAPGLRYVAPEWGQITGGSSNSGFVILGNPNLKPEKTINYELGLNFAPNDSLDTTLTAFYTKFKNKIETAVECDDPTLTKQCHAYGNDYNRVSTRQNVDNAVLKGIELSARWQPLENIILSSSYTWLDTEQKSGKNKGQSLNRMPKHTLNVHADWQATEQANLWAQMSYRGKEVETSTKGSKFGYQYPSYTTLDIGGSYKFDEKTSLFAGIYNVTNKKIEKDTYGKDLEGRRYWIGVSVDF